MKVSEVFVIFLKDVSKHCHDAATEQSVVCINIPTDGSKLLGFHLKLHPGVTYSHAASQICYPPILEGFQYDYGQYHNDI